MRKTGIAILMCGVSLAGHACAQQTDTVSSKVRGFLDQAWKDHTPECLAALDDLAPESGPSQTAKAIVDLKKATAEASASKFYELALQDSDLLELVATSGRTRNPDITDSQAVDLVFIEAGGYINNLFLEVPDGLYKNVVRFSKGSAKSRAHALYNLMTIGTTAKASDDVKGLYRTCYYLNRDRLFSLVSSHFK